MKVVDRQYVESHKEEILEAIREGSIFIYPTDTIYGLGCDATNESAVQKLRALKNRDIKPFSVMVPSFEWVEEHCDVPMDKVHTYLPGPYTLFVSRKAGVAEGVNPNDETLGIRMPKHWFSSVVCEAGVPFVTTSVNISGSEYMKRLEDVPEELLSNIDYAVYEGENSGEPSTKINLVSTPQL